MKKVFLFMIVMSLFAYFTTAKATITHYEEIAKSDKAGVLLYAKKRNLVYTDFKIDFQGTILSRPFWINTTNPTWSPQIMYEDIHQDGKNELIIILTKGSGTGILEREVHVFHIQNQLNSKIPVEVLVDDPIAIVLKNVKTELSPSKATIRIGEKNYTINSKQLGIQPEHLFDDVYFGNLVDFEIKDHQLIAKIGGQISPAGGYIGDVLITYSFKDKMYQATFIEFKPVGQ